MRDLYDVIVIGGGHAGTEAAWAAASVLRELDDAPSRPQVALITMDPAKIGTMSCNPAIGGLAKGQIVREIDALGGLMGLATDATGIMFKMLNTSKGAAVRGPRAQCDKYAYAAEVQRLISTRRNIDVIAGTVDDIVVEDGQVIGVMLPPGSALVTADQRQIDRNLAADALARPVFPTPSQLDSADGGRVRTAAATFVRAHAVVLTTGTFMRALMHTGERRTQGGRVGEEAAVGISATLRKLGLELGRLKTGTPPRLAQESLDWDSLAVQGGDEQPIPFSDLSRSNLADPEEARDSDSARMIRSFVRFPVSEQISCRITQTNQATHDLIRANLSRAPMYSGQIDAECGPRYCPSIEDKVVRFADRASHHIFLEPESLHTNEIYCNGISTSLPEDVQEKMVHAMPGCSHAKILRWGYAVEYDMVWPHQIDSTAMVKSIPGLFLAGQINGTSGYEEAGGQGLVAGLNAAVLSIRASQPGEHARAAADHLVRLGRDQAYLGVMMDDLVTKAPREPYRMFSSRAEHRLLLRADNADVRLTPLGRRHGLVDDARWRHYQKRAASLDALRSQLERNFIDGRSLRDYARRPDADLDIIVSRLEAAGHTTIDRGAVERVMTEAKYDGYITRQRAEVRRQSQNDHQHIPDWLDIDSISGLRRESAETLKRFRPRTLGQAARLAGLTPADLTLIAVHIRRGKSDSRSVRESRS